MDVHAPAPHPEIPNDPARAAGTLKRHCEATKWPWQSREAVVQINKIASRRSQWQQSSSNGRTRRWTSGPHAPTVSLFPGTRGTPWVWGSTGNLNGQADLCVFIFFKILLQILNCLRGMRICDSWWGIIRWEDYFSWIFLHWTYIFSLIFWLALLLLYCYWII